MRGNRFGDICHGDYARLGADGIAGKTVRIARAVEPLVMLAHNARDGCREVKSPQNGSVEDVRAHHSFAVTLRHSAVTSWTR